MGASLARAGLALGHDVVVVSGPVAIQYPEGAEVIDVLTTDEMLKAAGELFPECDGAIGAAAPCDYMPRQVSNEKLSKTGQPLRLELVETPDVIAMLGQSKRAINGWLVSHWRPMIGVFEPPSNCKKNIAISW